MLFMPFDNESSHFPLGWEDYTKFVTDIKNQRCLDKILNWKDPNSHYSGRSVSTGVVNE